MSRRKTPIPGGTSSGSARTVTLDDLTAASHPEAVVAGLLLAVIGTLVLVGLDGLLEPVASLEMFRPDLGFGALSAILAQIAVSVAALITAGLGLGKHPRFPILYLGVAAGLTGLIALDTVQWLSTGVHPGAFPILGAVVVAAVPYVVFSRRCRLIFLRRLEVDQVQAATNERFWGSTHGNAAVGVPVLPSRNSARDQGASTPRKPRQRRATVSDDGDKAAQGAALTVPSAPPSDPAGAALWAALYGSRPGGPKGSDGADDAESGSSAQGSSGPGGRRVGLEALINLRPPES